MFFQDAKVSWSLSTQFLEGKIHDILNRNSELDSLLDHHAHMK